MSVTIDETTCVGCGCCAEVCPAGALEMNDTATVHEEECTDCGSCSDMCPVGAIALRDVGVALHR